MKLAKCYSFFSIIVIMLALSSCANGEERLSIAAAQPDENFVDLTSTIYDKVELSELAEFLGSLDELNAQYPVECLREDNGIYRVSYCGDGCIAVLLFDNAGNKIMGNIYNTKLLKSAFDGLRRGKSLDEVMALDPNGEYLFLYAGRNDTPKVSSHYTEDGYLITIEYDDSNAIVRINESLI